MIDKKTRLSLIIPAYNEASRISKTLPKFKKYIYDHPQTEVVFVCDGNDETEEIIRSKMKNIDGLKVLVFGQRLGKGGAVKVGMLESRGTVRAFVDADLSTPLTQLDKIIEPISSNDWDLAIGSRGLSSSLVKARQGKLREFAGKMFGLGSRIVTGLPYRDFQCGFKAFSKEASQKIFPLQKITSPVFDVEVLYIAAQKKLRCLEVGVQWNHDNNSRIKYNFQNSIKAFLDLLKIRLDH